mgnify:CR=1 FL=1
MQIDRRGFLLITAGALISACSEQEQGLSDNEFNAQFDQIFNQQQPAESQVGDIQLPYSFVKFPFETKSANGQVVLRKGARLLKSLENLESLQELEEPRVKSNNLEYDPTARLIFIKEFPKGKSTQINTLIAGWKGQTPSSFDEEPRALSSQEKEQIIKNLKILAPNKAE